MSRLRFRILALDVDGTLLNHEGELLPTTKAAVARAAAAGVRPILCTGRRYRRAWPIARELGIDAPIVCNSGAIVKNPADDGTLWRADLAPEIAAGVLEIFHRDGRDVVAFNDKAHDQPDFRISRHPTGDSYFDDYVEQNSSHTEVASDWTTGPFFHLCAIGPRDAMRALQAVVLAAYGERVRTFVQRSPRYRGTMCEVISREAGKWSAVLHVAEQWGVSPEEICAVGDDVNDLPMIEGAGLGAVMGHAPPEVLAAADLVLPDHENDGVTTLINRLLAEPHSYPRIPSS